MKPFCIAVALILWIGLLACDTKTPLSSVPEQSTDGLSSMIITDETGTRTVDQADMDQRLRELLSNADYSDTLYAADYRIPWDADTRSMGCGMTVSIQTDGLQSKYCFPKFEGYRVIIYEGGGVGLAYSSLPPGYGYY